MVKIKIAKIKPKKRERQRSKNKDFYNTTAWRTVSYDFRNNTSPLCEACLEMGIMTDITPGDKKGVTDHVVPISKGGAMLDDRNFMGLCGVNSFFNHHAVKSGIELKFDIDCIETPNGFIPTQRGKREVIEKILGK